MKRILCLWLPDWSVQRLAAAQPGPNRGDREFFVALASWCHQFSPIVGVEDSPTPESLFLDITGLDPLFGGERALAERVVHAFAIRGLAVRAAIADTPGAAWAVVRFGNCSNRITVIPPGQASAALHSLPIDALRLSEEIVDLLHSLGIYRIEQLNLLPREELGRRFGPRLVERWDQAAGRLAEPIPVVPLLPQYVARYALEYPTESRETLSLVLERLAAEVAQRLVRCGRGAMQLECRLDCQPAEPVSLSVGLFEPTTAPHHLSQLILMHLERLSIPSPVTAVLVEASLTAPLDHYQGSLFADGPARSRPRLLAALLDRLASRLGRHSVLRARLKPEAQPELAYQYVPLVGGDRTRKRLPFQHDALLPRPLRLLRHPALLSMISVTPDGPPLRFRFRSREHQIVRSQGPERIETGWWRGRPIARDYYRVETNAGQRFWLFRSLDNGRWFLHGKFE